MSVIPFLSALENKSLENFDRLMTKPVHLNVSVWLDSNSKVSFRQFDLFIHFNTASKTGNMLVRRNRTFTDDVDGGAVLHKSALQVQIVR